MKMQAHEVMMLLCFTSLFVFVLGEEGPVQGPSVSQADASVNANELKLHEKPDLSPNFKDNLPLNPTSEQDKNKENKPDSSTVVSKLPIDPLNERENRGMAKRAIYVVLACSLIVVAYFAVKLVCKRKRKKERRYGLLTSNDIEMNDVDSDEDTTLFDAAQRL